VLCWGFNSRLDNLQAAVLNVKLKKYDSYVARRREVARLYDARLRHLPELHLPPAPDADPTHFDIFQNYEIEAADRDRLREHMEKRGVRTIVQWGGKTIQQFDKLGLRTPPLPYTERMTARFVLLPMNTALSDADVHYICDCVESFYSK
jgi:dTDP-4-amino-4,6-dideoxygalactose transaminase